MRSTDQDITNIEKFISYIHRSQEKGTFVAKGKQWRQSNEEALESVRRQTEWKKCEQETLFWFQQEGQGWVNNTSLAKVVWELPLVVWELNPW